MAMCWLEICQSDEAAVYQRLSEEVQEKYHLYQEILMALIINGPIVGT